jgi:hypothetical protein
MHPPDCHRHVPPGRILTSCLNYLLSVMNDSVVHEQPRRLTVHLPPRAHKSCALCKSDFLIPVPTLNTDGNDQLLVTRCAPCRKCSKCSKCCKVKKTKHFKRERHSAGNMFYKTCATCHFIIRARFQHRSPSTARPVLCSIEKQLRDDWRTAVRIRTTQWLPEQALIG